MLYRVEFTPEAADNLANLSQTIQERILRKIKWLSENFGDVSHQGLSAYLSWLSKLRIGDYRVIYSFDDKAEREVTSIMIHRVGHRREIYDA